MYNYRGGNRAVPHHDAKLKQRVNEAARAAAVLTPELMFDSSTTSEYIACKASLISESLVQFVKIAWAET